MTKIIQSIPALLALIGTASAHISYWCIYSNGACYTTWVNHIYESFTHPLYFFTLYSLPLTILLVFIRRDVFNSWLKLALWAVPLSVIFIANTDVNSGGAYFVLYSFYRDDAARFTAIVFSVVSLALISWKYFKTRNIRTS